MKTKSIEMPKGAVPSSFNKRVIKYSMARNNEIRHGIGVLLVRTAPKAKSGIRVTILDERNLGHGHLITIRIDLDEAEAKQIKEAVNNSNNENILSLNTAGDAKLKQSV